MASWRWRKAGHHPNQGRGPGVSVAGDAGIGRFCHNQRIGGRGENQPFLCLAGAAADSAGAGYGRGGLGWEAAGGGAGGVGATV